MGDLDSLILSALGEAQMANTQLAQMITKGVSTLPTTGWVANTGENTLKYDLLITDVTVDNWVDVTVDKDYQDVAQEMELNPTVEEYNGGITFFANIAPTVNIPIRYKVVK